MGGCDWISWINYNEVGNETETSLHSPSYRPRAQRIRSHHSEHSDADLDYWRPGKHVTKTYHKQPTFETN